MSFCVSASGHAVNVAVGSSQMVRSGVTVATKSDPEPADVVVCRYLVVYDDVTEELAWDECFAEGTVSVFVHPKPTLQ